MKTEYDAIVIGGGHNGLVCAGYLARAGERVLVLERRSLVGGACVTEELWPGYKVSTAAYVVSLLLPEIVRDLELEKHGYRVLPRDPSSFTPLEDGRSLLLGHDDELNFREISKFSEADAHAYPKYEALLTRVAERLEPALSQPAPDVLPLPQSWRRRSFFKRLRDARKGYGLYKAFGKLGEELPEAIELLTGPATAILDRWFESDVLKGTLATDAIIGTFQPPSAPGTAYVLLHHVMGAAGGKRGVWGYVEGGMGKLTQAMAESCREAGTEIITDAEVSEILVENDCAHGVRLADGREFLSPKVASNLDAHNTFEKLVPDGVLRDSFARAVSRIDYSSASLKINLAVSELPNFTCRPHQGNEPQPHHRGTIHIGSTVDYIERAYDDAKYGRPSERPVIELTIPSAVDSTIAPSGHHVLSMFVQYAPYHLGEGSWTDVKEEFADRCIAELGRYAPNVPRSVLHRQVLTPVDLESTFGLTGGNIFQGAMPLHQLFSFRPVPGWADHRTPLRGLFLCGSAAHPGGGVMGAAGRNAARELRRR